MLNNNGSATLLATPVSVLPRVAVSLGRSVEMATTTLPGVFIKKPVREAPQPIHSYLHILEPDIVKQAAHDYLVELLHKRSMSASASELRLTVATLHRIISTDDRSCGSSYLTAAYIVFMCETNIRILRILDDRPKRTAFFNRHGEKRYAPVTK